MDRISWKSPWKSVIDKEAESLAAELRREVGNDHSLFGLDYRVVGRRVDTDDIILLLPSGPLSFAVVHLTWSGKPEKAPFPYADFFGSAYEAFEESAER